MPSKSHPRPALATADILLTLRQVADYLQVSTRTVYLWSQAGTIPGFQIGNQWRYRQADLDTWIENSRATTRRVHA